MTIGEKIRMSRENKGLSQGELANLIGVNSSTVISNWETGKNKPDVEQISRLCSILECSADFLVLDQFTYSDKNTPGKRLSLLIEESGLKVKKFAELSGVVPTTLSKFLNDKSPMSDKYIRRAAKLLDTTYEYIKHGVMRQENNVVSNVETAKQYCQFDEEMITQIRTLQCSIQSIENKIDTLQKIFQKGISVEVKGKVKTEELSI